MLIPSEARNALEARPLPPRAPSTCATRADGHADPHWKGGTLAYQYVFTPQSPISPTLTGARDFVHRTCRSATGGLPIDVTWAWLSGEIAHLTIAWPLPDLDRPLDVAVLVDVLNRACGLANVA